MRLLFLTKYYPPTEGGIERYSELLCNGLTRKGVHVEVVAASERGNSSRTENVSGVLVHRVKNWGQFAGVPWSPSMPWHISRASRRCDIVHLNYPNPLADLSFMLLRSARPAVLTYHSDIMRNAKLLRLYRPLAKRLLKRANAIIATSPNYLRTSEELQGQRERCKVIPLPVETSRFQSIPSAIVKEQVDRYGSYVLFVGRFAHYKGIEFLLQAVAEINVSLVLVGRGELEARHKAQARELGIESRAHFLGKVPDDRLAALYKGARCLVLPSTNRAEAFGMVLGEALACGTPVISTELGTGTSFVNQDGRTGFVVPPGDTNALAGHIKQLLEDQALAESLGGRDPNT